jgi:hypothetical protein
MEELVADAPVKTHALGHLSFTSAPTRSQSAAISLMKVILVARNALAAYLIISADSRSVVTIGKSRR